MLRIPALGHPVVNRAHALCPDGAWWKVVSSINYGGARLLDLISSNHAALTNVTQSTTSGWNLNSPPGGAGSILFDGTDDYLATPTSGFTLTTATKFSACLWVKTTLTNVEGNLMSTINFSNFGGLQFAINVFFNATSRAGKVTVLLQSASGSTSRAVYGSTAVNDGAWHHVCITYDGSNTAAGISIYVDGKKDTVTIQTDTDPGTLSVCYPRIGARLNNNVADDFFSGRIDDVRLYKRKLSAVDVRQLYENSLLGCPGLINASTIAPFSTALTYSVNLSVQATGIPSIVQKIGRTLSQTVTGTPSYMRGITRSANQTLSAQPVIIRQAAQQSQVQTTATPTSTPRPNRALSQTVTGTPSIPSKAATRSITVQSTGTPAVDRNVPKTLIVTATGTPSQSAIQGKSFAIQATGTATIPTKIVGRTITLLVTATPTQSRAIARTQSVTATGTPTIRVSRNRALSVQLTGAPSVRTLPTRVLAVVATATQSIRLQISRLFNVTITGTPTNGRSALKRLSTSSTAQGLITGQRLHAESVIATGSTTVTKVVGRTFALQVDAEPTIDVGRHEFLFVQAVAQPAVRSSLQKIPLIGTALRIVGQIKALKAEGTITTLREIGKIISLKGKS